MAEDDIADVDVLVSTDVTLAYCTICGLALDIATLGRCDAPPRCAGGALMEAWRMTMNLKTPQKGTRAQKMGGSADNLRCSDRSRPQGQEASQQLCTSTANGVFSISQQRLTMEVRLQMSHDV